MSEEEVGDDPSLKFDDMDLDSLAFEEIQLALENAYGFTISYEEAQAIRTLRDAIDFTNRKLDEKGGPSPAYPRSTSSRRRSTRRCWTSAVTRRRTGRSRCC